MGLFPKKAADRAIDLAGAQAELRRQRWGQPGRCPSCNGVGYLDHIDLIDRIMYQHCTECMHRWSVNESELASISA